MERRKTECVDCFEERKRRGTPYPRYARKTIFPGPRCASHHRQKVKAAKSGAHERRVQRTYGLAQGQYRELYVHQNQVCAICCRATGKTRNLSVDHDHKTGLVRGLLCFSCNDLLGHIRDDVDTARRIVRYLLDPPARQLGIVALHEDFREVVEDAE